MNIERALPADGGPYLTIEVTAWLVAGAVTSFCNLDNQTNDAEDHKTELKQI